MVETATCYSRASMMRQMHSFYEKLIFFKQQQEHACTKVLPELHSWRNTSRPSFTWNDSIGNPLFLKIELIVWFIYVFGMLQYSISICSYNCEIDILEFKTPLLESTEIYFDNALYHGEQRYIRTHA